MSLPTRFIATSYGKALFLALYPLEEFTTGIEISESLALSLTTEDRSCNLLILEFFLPSPALTYFYIIDYNKFSSESSALDRDLDLDFLLSLLEDLFLLFEDLFLLFEDLLLLPDRDRDLEDELRLLLDRELRLLLDDELPKKFKIELHVL